MKILYMGTAADERIPGMFCNCETCQKALKLGGRNIMTRSQALIDNQLLIDFGGDTYFHFLAQNKTLWYIENILLTHSHMDHLSLEQFSARYHWYTAETTKYPALKLYASQDLIDKVWKVVGARGLEKEMIEQFFKFIPVQPFVTFEVDAYMVTPLPARHAKGEQAFIYLIERDGKTIFYGNDTGFFDEAVDEWLVQNGKYIDLLSLDCTKGDKESPYYGHMSMSEGKAIADRFKAKGLIDEQTLLYYTHFSHCCEMVYDDLQAVAKEKYGFEVAFDGLKVGI